MSIWIIASLTFRETVRRRALLGAILLTLGFLALFGVGSFYAFRDIFSNPRLTGEMQTLAIGEILLAGLFGVANIGALLAIFVAAGTIATEVEEGTLHAIVPRPLRRWEIVLGKWLGFALMVAIYVAITGLAASLIIYYVAGYISPLLIQGLALLSLKALLLLSVSILLSTRLPALTTGIVAFILYAVANVGGMVEQFGYLVRNSTLVEIGVITSLIMPSDALWKMAAAAFQPPIGDSILATLRGVGPFSVLNPPSVWMGAYAVAYLVVALLGALLIFERRDL
jgi:ABC-type transport system involved in multi-copper enzyme maturation permease subunit